MTIGTDIELNIGPARPRLRPVAVDATTRAVAAAVVDGLLRARKRLPAWLLYDDQGSALFEEITELPEYYLTRTERAILTDNASAMIEAAGPPLSVVELGAGSASKTRHLLQALLRHQGRGHYMPVDVSPSALAQAQHELRGLEKLVVQPVVARYPEDLGFLRAMTGRRLVLFLGSNIGNYDARAARTLLAAVRRHLTPGDAFLMGTDLRKSPAHLLPAYDDDAGVTARFSKNVLARLNRDLGANFALDRFQHLVRWNGAASRIELFLQSLADQRVTIKALGVSVPFAAGERIHTESSYKFTGAMVRTLLTGAGFRLQTTWYDPRRWFAVHLARVPEASGRSSAAARAATRRRSGG